LSAIACLAWVLSVAPLFLLRVPEAADALAVAPVQLVLLPWLALAGLPRAKVCDKSAWRAHVALWIALSAAPTAAALSLGPSPGPALLASAAAATLLHVLLAAGAWSVRSAAALRAHAVLWFGLVALAPILTATLSFSSPSAPSPLWWIQAWASLSPLQWWWEQAAGSTHHLPIRPLCTALVLLLPSWNRGRGES
jgi:hypothetical protein